MIYISDISVDIDPEAYSLNMARATIEFVGDMQSLHEFISTLRGKQEVTQEDIETMKEFISIREMQL